MNRKPIKIIKDSEKLYTEHHNEYLEMKKRNQERILKVRERMSEQESHFKETKSIKLKNFNFIRNK